MPLLEAFKRAAEENANDFELIGDCMLVAEVPAEEVKTKSGLILSVGGPIRQIDGIEANRPCWVRVLQVGKGYYEEGDTMVDGRDVPLDTRPGDIVLVGKLAVKWFSVFGPMASNPEQNLGLIRESEVQARFRGQEGYDRYFNTIKRELQLDASV